MHNFKEPKKGLTDAEDVVKEVTAVTPASVSSGRNYDLEELLRIFY